jgi:hypothetical protein
MNDLPVVSHNPPTSLARPNVPVVPGNLEPFDRLCGTTYRRSRQPGADFKRFFRPATDGAKHRIGNDPLAWGMRGTPLCAMHASGRSACRHRHGAHRHAGRGPYSIVNPTGATMDDQQLTVEVAKEFHRRMAAIIADVQAGIWQDGLHALLGYATDYAFGQERGVQTLVLKTRNRSAYLRLHWDTLLGDAAPQRQLVDDAVARAINELI